MHPNSYSMNLPYRHRVQPPISSLTYDPLGAGLAASGAAAAAAATTAGDRAPYTMSRTHHLEHERSMLLAQARRANFARAAAEAARAEQVQRASLDYLQFQEQQALRARQMQQARYEQQQAMLNMSLRAQAAEMATQNALYARGAYLPYFDTFGIPMVPTTQEAERRRQLYEMDMMAARSRSAAKLRSEADRIDAQQRRLVLQRKRVSDQAAAEGRALQSRLANEQAKTEAAAARAAAAAAERAAAEARQAYEAAAIADMRSLQLSAQLSRDRELFGALANRALKGVDVDLYDPLLDDLYVPAKNSDKSSVYTHPWRPSYASKDVMTWRGRKVRVHHASGRATKETSGQALPVLDGNSQVGRQMERSPSHRAALVENQELREKIAKVEELSTIAADMAPLDQKLDIPSRPTPAFKPTSTTGHIRSGLITETATPEIDADSAAEKPQKPKENSKPVLEETNEEEKETSLLDDQKTAGIQSKDIKVPNPTKEKDGAALAQNDEKNPATEKEDAPDTEEGEAPAAKIEEAPAAEIEETPAAEIEETPAAEKEESPAAEKEETPAAEKEESPAAEKEESPAAEQEQAPADEKGENDAAKKEDAPADEKDATLAVEKDNNSSAAPPEEDAEEGQVLAAGGAGNAGEETTPAPAEINESAKNPAEEANEVIEAGNEAIHDAAASAVGNILSAASPGSK